MKFIPTEETPLLEFLVLKMSPISKTTARTIIKSKRIKVNGKETVKADTVLFPGNVVEVLDKQKLIEEEAPFKILFEDAHLLVAEKPPGLLTISTDNEKEKTFYRMVSWYVKENSHGKGKVFIVHRLDREVSGIIVFAKSEEVKEKLQQGWQETKKFYYALTEGQPEEDEGTIESNLKENTVGIVFSTDQKLGSYFSITHFKVMKRFLNHCLFQIEIETGRKHQIRVHLADMGCPIVGDKKYGATGSPIKRMGLHAYSLSFTHPINGKRLELELPVPEIFLKFGRRADIKYQ